MGLAGKIKPRIEAGLSLISEQAANQSYDAKFNGFSAKDFADKFLRG